MKLNIIDHPFHYEMEKLSRIFFPDDVTVFHEANESGNYITTKRIKRENGDIIYVRAVYFSKVSERECFVALCDGFDAACERKMAQLLFSALSELTGYVPPWGILTGVRPAKLMTGRVSQLGEKGALEYFENELSVSEEKARLALTVAENEAPIIKRSGENSFSLYISIPFCPTRCSYCSFVSHSNEQAKKLIPQYVDKLCEEISLTGEIIGGLGLKLETVYYGGGTPTTLSAGQYERISSALAESFDLSTVSEYTVEAGRPDTVTDEKLKALKKSGCTRISVNPQTFNDSVLEQIGRKHTSAQTLKAMELARENGFDNINMDLIAGLPTDTLESFNNTLDTALSLSPESITVHTLSKKRASSISTEHLETNDAELVGKMLSSAGEKLTAGDYAPYYMYRQSKCLGNFENVGWAKKGFECLYNVYMMEECHTVIALGAGGVSKLKSPRGNEIERVFNFKYPYEYINKFQEIIKRKEQITEFYSKIRKG
ncbi:MAG: coproporphyrinogen dehydrogenase HemZ [Oscillospiraceae bacterium]|nr:coproporphyrinogen dehydrogenase HemZ [Oscillospiraceae bacterium]